MTPPGRYPECSGYVCRCPTSPTATTRVISVGFARSTPANVSPAASPCVHGLTPMPDVPGKNDTQIQYARTYFVAPERISS